MKEHYLITVRLDSGHHVHAYVMTADPDPQRLEYVRNRVMDVALSVGSVSLPIILETKLGDATDMVRDILRTNANDDKVTRNLANAKNWHMSIFTLPLNHPDDKKLMELH